MPNMPNIPNLQTMPKTTFKAIIFDLDGTLLDTLPDITAAMHTILARHALPDPYTADDFRAMVGWGAELLLKQAVPTDWQTGPQLARLVRELLMEYQKEPCAHTVPFPEIPELLTALEELSLPKAILSNKDHEVTLSVVKQRLGQWKFEFIQGATSTFPHKPAPDGALDLARRMQLPPAEIILVGDSEIDMETAVRAGMQPAGALWGYRSEAEIVRGGARYLLSSPLRLLDLLK